jgi:hypothetical protein
MLVIPIVVSVPILPFTLEIVYLQENLAEIYTQFVLKLPSDGFEAKHYEEFSELFLGHNVLTNTIDSYAELLFRKCKPFYSVIRTSVFNYKDIALSQKHWQSNMPSRVFRKVMGLMFLTSYTKNTSTCITLCTLSQVAETFRTSIIVIWPHYDECGGGHWVLEIFYTRLRTVAFVDSFSLSTTTKRCHKVCTSSSFACNSITYLL